jgi:putative Mn2+ efflux pump MntP
MTNLAPLLIGAALVGVIHMAAPDHWVTLCLLGKASCWTERKLLTVSTITAVAHSVLSAVLGLTIAVIGSLFSDVISRYISLIIGSVMLAAGLIIGVKSILSKKKREVTPEEKLLEKTQTTSQFKSVGYFAVLGAALSPDLSITPFFLAAVPVSFVFALVLFVIFVVTSIITQVVLVQLATKGLTKTFEKIPEKYNDAIVGFVIAAIGIYILIAG